MNTRQSNTQSLIGKAKQILRSLSQDEISSIIAALQSTCDTKRRNILSKLSNHALLKFVAAEKLWHGTC